MISRAKLTYGLIAASLLIFVAMLATGKSSSGPSMTQLLDWGADWGPLSLHYQWWRMFSSTFLHFSWAHLLNNLLTLWILGRLAEPLFGRIVFGTLYVGSGLAASIASLGVTPEAVVCGASGAIFGLFGALVSAFLRGNLVLYSREKWWLGLLSAGLLYSLYAGASNPGISNSAHVAGLGFGLVCGALASSRMARRPKFRWWMLSGSAGVLLVGAIPVQAANGYLASLACANTALDQNQPDEALFHVNSVLRRNPNSDLASRLAGECYFKKRDYINAEIFARKILAKKPDDGSAEFLLGKVLVRTGRAEDALDLAHNMISKGGNDHEASLIIEQALNGFRKVRMADALIDKKPDLAISLYKQALEDWPENYKALRGLSQAYKKQGMPKEAAEAAARAGQVQAAQLE